ncbi:MAG TPA: hypothetical protein VJI75_03235, partial [Candidatus Nanoarchaeia archaeon]|nr:hypothetical protein [Candidatus Nanoarchaeia archaeon]
LRVGEGLANNNGKNKVRYSMTEEAAFNDNESLREISRMIVDASERYHFEFNYCGIRVYELAYLRPVDQKPLKAEELQRLEEMTLKNLMAAHDHHINPDKRLSLSLPEKNPTSIGSLLTGDNGKNIKTNSIMKRHSIKDSLQKVFDDYSAWVDKFTASDKPKASIRDEHELQLRIYSIPNTHNYGYDKRERKLSTILQVYPMNSEIQSLRRLFAEGRLVPLKNPLQEKASLDSLLSKLTFSGDFHPFTKIFSHPISHFDSENSFREIAETAADMLKRYHFSLFYCDRPLFLSYTSSEGIPSIVYTLHSAVVAGNTFKEDHSEKRLLHDLLIHGSLRYIDANRPRKR